MQITRRLLVCFAIATALGAQVTPEQFAAIEREGTERSQVMAHLDHLTNRIGPRLTSSDNLTVACEWARDTFAAFGLDNARLEQWGTYAVGFNRGPWWGRVLRPEPMELAINTNAWTAGTRGPARGLLLLAPQDERQLAAMRGKLGKVWLLDPPDARRSEELLAALTAAVLAEGGFGFVSSGPGDGRLLTSGRPPADMAQLPQLPSVQLRHDCHQKLRQQLDAGREVEVEIELRNHFRRGPIPVYNVIADLVGSEHPEQFVVVGGHIDSWDGATGTTDNGTGTATTLEAARILTAIGARPKRSIRFMLWSGEEQGLQGSRAWVQQHRAELADYSACLVHDGGTNYVSGIAGMKEMRPQLATVFAPLLTGGGDMPFAIRDIPAFSPIGSDHESFTAAGVPGFFWSQAGRARYNHTHHTQYDTFDAAIPEYQMHSSVVIATGALGLANLPDLLTRENMKVNARGSFPRGGGRRLGVTLDPDQGLTVVDVTGGGAAQIAGMQVGDRLVKIGDRAIEKQADIRPAILAAPAKTNIVVRRKDAEVTLTVTFDR